LLKALVLNRLQALQHTGKKLIPRLRAGEMQDEATGVTGNFATHINNASHHSCPKTLNG